MRDFTDAKNEHINRLPDKLKTKVLTNLKKKYIKKKKKKSFNDLLG